MLQIKVNPKEYSVEMEGHAGFSETGQDVVCAGASMLFYALSETIINYKSTLTEEPYIDLEETEDNIKAIMTCKPKKDYEPNIQTVLYTITNGFKLLAEGYPNNVKLLILD